MVTSQRPGMTLRLSEAEIFVGDNVVVSSGSMISAAAGSILRAASTPRSPAALSR